MFNRLRPPRDIDRLLDDVDRLITEGLPTPGHSRGDMAAGRRSTSTTPARNWSSRRWFPALVLTRSASPSRRR